VRSHVTVRRLEELGSSSGAACPRADEEVAVKVDTDRGGHPEGAGAQVQRGRNQQRKQRSDNHKCRGNPPGGSKGADDGAVKATGETRREPGDQGGGGAPAVKQHRLTQWRTANSANRLVRQPLGLLATRRQSGRLATDDRVCRAASLICFARCSRGRAARLRSRTSQTLRP